ncbi:Helix-turn-helix domain-containing protein [Pseudobutyrivibrio sp. 49]|uniref:helix-turn-helix domain-containing protein n=1 Tax=unclassified Pseudobutyrivibrio TaxID=2638619 RepID=UPI0008802211|nr:MULTISPECIES: helix-turn-helix transcriptional regulator [unclassified Pseudobutyrivibrio]SDH69968.1 Helix-turn-helix domain-containing protein [Pseudobutyrivibrio sp. 49]SFN73058.1 Helix-turn-helix domain-containing protein [Pseudobutyrivibrio sp. UC1225]
MGRKSIRDDKNIFFESREAAGLTRAQASELIGTISESRLEKLETGKAAIYPEDVVDMASAYKKPELCNYYCTHECRIGKESVPEVKVSSLSEIVLGMLSALNSLDKQKDRLIEITADGIVSDDEIPDFVHIQKQLDQIDHTVEALKLWVANTINSGNINADRLKEYSEK